MDFENKLMMITPAIINNIPNNAGKSNFCLSTITLMASTSTIPVPAQIA